MLDVKRSTLNARCSSLPRSSRFPVGRDSVEPYSCLSSLHLPRSMFNLLLRAHVGRFEQEPTEATEVDSSLCFLGYLLLNLAAEAFAPMRRISFRVFGVFRGYISSAGPEIFEDMDTSPNEPYRANRRQPPGLRWSTFS